MTCPDMAETSQSELSGQAASQLLESLLLPANRNRLVSLPDDLYRYYRHVATTAAVFHIVNEARILRDFLGTDVGNSILDVGCGYGLNATVIRILGTQKVTGLDFGHLKIKTATRIARTADLSGITFLRGSAAELPFQKNSFSGLLMTSAISHFYDLERCLAEAHRVLKPGGVLLIRDDTNALNLPTRHEMKSIWDKTEYGDDDELAGLGQPQNFTTLRRELILSLAPDTDTSEADDLAREGRGWTAEDIERYLGGQSMRIRPQFRCINPVTYVPQEQLLNPFRVLRALRRIGYTAELCRPPIWGYGGRTFLGKIRKLVRELLWPLQIPLYKIYYIRATKVAP